MPVIHVLLAGAVFLAAGLLLALVFNRSEQRAEPGSLIIEKPTVSQLVDIVARTLDGFLRQNFSNQNLTRQELENKKAAKARLRVSLNESVCGDRENKAVVLEYIRSVITTNRILRVTEKNINEFVPFDDPEKLSAQDQFFILLHGYQRLYGREALTRMFSDLAFDTLTDVSDKEIKRAYQLFLNPEKCREYHLPEGLTELDFEEKLDFLSHRIFEQYKGLGAADVLFETDVDEIDAGVSGIPAGSFELSNKFIRNAHYSYEAIWISLHGRNIHLSCLSFGSEEDLERVCHNIYKYRATQVLSREKGYVVSVMKSGARVVVTRPPFSDRYAFFVRKFDSSPSILPEKYITGPGCEIPLILCKWFVKGQRNIAITGQQNTGKTTLLKSLIYWIKNLNIRTQELAFELNLAFSYPDKNVTAFQETDSISSQEGLNLQKKTNGAVNIIGEAATAEQCSHIIQTSNIASLYTIFTYHAKTTRALVEMFALSLLQLGLYKEKRDAVEISAKTLNVDIHLENTKGFRHIAQISEIIPVDTQEYPSETMQREYREKYGKELPYSEEMAALDQREFYRRQTDRHLFDINEICRWEDGQFVMRSMPSDTMIREIASRLTDKEEEREFYEDMDYLRQVSNRKQSA